FTTSGILNISNGSIINGNVGNSGTIKSSGLATINGNLSNTGTLTMQNGVTTDVTKVTGTYSAGGPASLLVDFTTAGTGSSDKLAVGGTVSGNTAVQFNVLQPGGFVNDVKVVTSGGGAGNFTGSIPDALTWSYQFVRQGNDWVVNAIPNKNFAP